MNDSGAAAAPFANLGFFGAAGTVTGSRYLLQHQGERVLVDCGLFQGYKKLRERNWQEPGFEPAALSAVVLTHAHLDHSGYLPRLCESGFRGPVFCTPGTRDLLQILLPDSGFLQEEEARNALRFGYSRHANPEPLYTREQAERCLERLRTVPFGETFGVSKGLRAKFTRAGHIVGSACVAFDIHGTRLTFSGDVGRPNDPIMRPPESLANTDYLVIESTYGDRRHPRENSEDLVAGIVNRTAEQGGVVVIPAFAVGRAQHLLHVLYVLKKARRIPDVPVFLDSPMAIDATEIFRAHAEEHRLPREDCQSMFELARFSKTSDDSKAIDASTGPMIIISASGMATGGRVLHHLARFLPDPRNTVLLVGYQSAGTRGRLLADGCDELKIHGRYVPVRARIAQAQGLSAHADYGELCAWLEASKLSPKRVFVTHGEPGASDALRRRLKDSFGWDCVVPDDRASFELSGQR
ncbi:MAG TPA: MBL fold metallo-hydrolase [Polyangiaceae bacterium]|nr:MBL fold metallo-hydrolase [Polyangiaceae bacterium]